MRVRWMRTKARHAAISFEVVEWSEQLRPVISVWLGAVRRSVQVRLCTSGCKSEKMFGGLSPPRDLLPSISIIISVIIIITQVIPAHRSQFFIQDVSPGLLRQLTETTTRVQKRWPFIGKDTHKKGSLVPIQHLAHIHSYT